MLARRSGTSVQVSMTSAKLLAVLMVRRQTSMDDEDLKQNGFDPDIPQSCINRYGRRWSFPYNTGVSGPFAILNPCAKRWTNFSGDGRKRFCDECQTFVHAIDQYSRPEIDELRRNSPRVCGLLTGESPPAPPSRRAILVGALLTTISPLMAQSGRVRVRVTDATGGGVFGAEVSLLASDGNPQRTETADASGEVVLTDLPIGNLALRITSRGFNSRLMTVTVRGPEELRVDAKLEVGFVGEVVEVDPRSFNYDASPAVMPIPSQLDPPAETGHVFSDSFPIGSPRTKRRWWHIFRR